MDNNITIFKNNIKRLDISKNEPTLICILSISKSQYLPFKSEIYDKFIKKCSLCRGWGYGWKIDFIKVSDNCDYLIAFEKWARNQNCEGICSNIVGRSVFEINSEENIGFDAIVAILDENLNIRKQKKLKIE